MSQGITNAILAFGLWGISPLFWKQLKLIPSAELIAWRIILTFLSILLLLLTQKKIDQINFKYIPIKKVITASILIAINWLVFIYAVNSSQVLQGSLGYFMGPLFSFFIGFFWLKEKVGPIQIVALVCFISAIFILSNRAGLPWISLTLAITFAVYGLIKKQVKLIPQVSLFYETLFIIPFCLIYILLNEGMIQNLPFGKLPYLITAGFFTYLPLHFFAKAAQTIKLTTLGVLQYLAPLGQFLVGRFIYNEPFETYQIWAYALVWLGIILFTSNSFIHKVKKQ